MVTRNLSRPKTASLLDSLERCRTLIAEYRLEQRSCIGKSDDLKRQKVISTLNHLLQRMKGIEAMLARYPAKEADPKHLNCQSLSQSKPESSGASVKFDFSTERENMSRPKAANIQDSLESCKSLLAEYRLEQRSCIRKQDQKKRKVLDCRIYHLLKRKKRIEAILSRYPVRILDSNHWKCQSSKQTQLKTAPTDPDKLKKFSLPSHDAVVSTLTRVDDQIKILEEDSTWCQSDLKISHMIELLKFKDRVENILRIYPNGELTLKKRAAPAGSKKPPQEIAPFLNELNKCDAEIAQIKEDPMWEMLKYKKDHLTELLQMRKELEDSINENEKGKKYLEDLSKDPKIKLSGKLKLALKSVDDKIAEIMDDKNWESHEDSRNKMKKLRKNKQNLEDIIRHHNGEDFLKSRTENESAAVKLPHKVMQNEVKDLEKIERQITDLEKQEDTKFKKIYMDKLIRTKSNVETSIIFYKNGKEYLKQHALKKELLKLQTDLEAIDDQLAKIDASEDEKETPEEKATRKVELMKNKEEIEKKIEEIDSGKEYLERRAQSKSMNELVKLPDEAAESVAKLDQIEKEIAEVSKEPDSDEKTSGMQELVKSKEETETEIKQFEDGQKFLDQRKDGTKTSDSKKPKPTKKYCAKLPKKVFLQITLKKINEQILSIEKDSSWCHSEYKSTRMAELLYYKDNVKKILKKFSKKDDSAEDNKSEEKPAIELNDETKKLVEDLDKVQADIKELESSKSSQEVEKKKAELVKSKTDLEANIKQQKSGTEFLERREENKDEKAPEPVKTSKKPEIPKKIMVTLKSVENQMERIEEDDRWDTNEHKKLMIKHLKKSKDNIESIIKKCQGGEELLVKKAKNESSRIKLPKEASEQVRKLDSIEEKTEQANNWGDSGYKKKYLGSLEKSKSEIETAIKKVEKGEDYLKQRAELKAKQEKKIQQKKETALKDKEEKKAKMDAEKAKRRSAGGMKPSEDDEEESKPTEVEAKYPKMVVILDTLDKVEKMIEAIEREVKWCTSDIKTARIIELLRSKENIELFIGKCPGGEEALAKRALEAEAAEKRLPKLPHKMKTKKITLPHALTVAEKLISKFQKDIASADNVRKIVLEKKLMKFKKLIDVAIEDSPEYKNKKENDEEREQSKSPESSSAKEKAKTPSSQPRAVNPPKKVALINTLKTMQTITTAIEKDPTYKCSKTRLLYYQSLKQREDKLMETLNSLPKEDVNSIHYKNHLKLKEAQEKRELEMNNRKRCPEYQNIRSKFNSKSILHKPKRSILSYTLYRMGYRMNDDKRQRIRCQLGPKPMKPE
ncbi:unnamed protein product [Diamesa hyperborea]